MAYTRESKREAVERVGDEYWRALIAPHVDTYPASRSTPGDVCRLEAERLNALDLRDAEEFALIETRVEHAGPEITLAPCPLGPLARDTSAHGAALRVRLMSPC